MPYNLINKIDPKYGDIILIEAVDIGEYKNPIDAAEKAKSLRAKLLISGDSKVRIFVDGQVMTSNQINSWAAEEYKLIPKCEQCRMILSEDVYINRFSERKLFCSTKCADDDYTYQADLLLDEEEIEL